jgi:hypothetical protein
LTRVDLFRQSQTNARPSGTQAGGISTGESLDRFEQFLRRRDQLSRFLLIDRFIVEGRRLENGDHAPSDGVTPGCDVIDLALEWLVRQQVRLAD